MWTFLNRIAQKHDHTRLMRKIQFRSFFNNGGIHTVQVYILALAI